MLQVVVALGLICILVNVGVEITLMWQQYNNNIVLVTCTNFCCFLAQISGNSLFVRSFANALIYEYVNTKNIEMHKITQKLTFT